MILETYQEQQAIVQPDPPGQSFATVGTCLLYTSLAATLLPDAPPEEAAALVARMAEENLAGPTTPRKPKTVELARRCV